MSENVTIIHRNGDPEAHKAGCSHLNRRRSIWDAEPYTFAAETRDEVVYEVWGASGVATDDYQGDITGWHAFATATPEFVAYTLERYSDQVHFAPCLKGLK